MLGSQQEMRSRWNVAGRPPELVRQVLRIGRHVMKPRDDTERGQRGRNGGVARLVVAG